MRKKGISYKNCIFLTSLAFSGSLFIITDFLIFLLEPSKIMMFGFFTLYGFFISGSFYNAFKEMDKKGMLIGVKPMILLRDVYLYKTWEQTQNHIIERKEIRL